MRPRSPPRPQSDNLVNSEQLEIHCQSAVKISWTISKSLLRNGTLVVWRGNKSPHLIRALSDVSKSIYDPKQRRFFLSSPVFIFWFGYFLISTRGLQQSLVLAFLKSARTRVIILMENYDKKFQSKAEETTWMRLVESYLVDIQVVKVQHGQELRRQVVPEKKFGTLAVWGQYSADSFPAFGRSEAHYVVTGPLQDSRYRQLRGNSVPQKIWDICIISTVKSEEWWGPAVSQRRKGYDLLMKYLVDLVDELGLSVAIATTVDRFTIDGENQAELERRYFEDRFGSRCFFPDSSETFGGLMPDLLVEREKVAGVKERYATYALSDSSGVTIGATGSSLWESFGRGNKILAVNLSPNSALNFPISGPWALGEATYEEFRRAYCDLASMEEGEFERISRGARNHLIYYDDRDRPENRLNRLVRALLNHGDPLRAKDDVERVNR